MVKNFYQDVDGHMHDEGNLFSSDAREKLVSSNDAVSQLGNTEPTVTGDSESTVAVDFVEVERVRSHVDYQNKFPSVGCDLCPDGKAVRQLVGVEVTLDVCQECFDDHDERYRDKDGNPISAANIAWGVWFEEMFNDLQLLHAIHATRNVQLMEQQIDSVFHKWEARMGRG